METQLLTAKQNLEILKQVHDVFNANRESFDGIDFRWIQTEINKNQAVVSQFEEQVKQQKAILEKQVASVKKRAVLFDALESKLQFSKYFPELYEQFQQRQVEFEEILNAEQRKLR